VISLGARPAFPYSTTVRVSLWTGVLVVAALFGWGSWQRRWIADDGLIVLRTVRNLLAGNGPVFNQGERVEANTSTAWTYLMYAGSWIGGPMRMEYVALALALVLSVLGIPDAGNGAAVRTELARPPGDHAARRRAGLHRAATGA
jgi:arabinofuranosyltransferase